MTKHELSQAALQKEVAEANKKINSIRSEIGKIVVGQERVLNDIFICLLTQGNILLEGAPGLAKTLMVKSLAASVGGVFKRIQFTADLLPTDITGFEGYEPKKGFFISKGPVFANFILADEINRAPPKVQSALMEVMQEKQVTIAKETYHLELPFIVLATENPIETRGSLTSDQYVFINGELKKGTELLNQIKNSKVLLSDGKIKLFDINNSWTFALNEDGKLVKKNCYLYTLAYNDEVISLKTATGRKIKVTKNHPFLINDNGLIKWRTAEELSLNDHLVSIRKFPPFENTKKEIRTHAAVLKNLENKYNIVYHEDLINLKEKSNDFNDFSCFNGKDFDKLRIASTLSIKNLFKELNLKDKRYYWQLIRFFRRSTSNDQIKKLLSDYFSKTHLNLKKETDYIESFTITRINRFEVDADIIFLLAFLLSDGSISNNYIAIYQKNYPKALNEFIDIVQNKVGSRISDITKDPSGKSVILRSKPLADYLNLRFNLRKEGNNSRLPSWLLSLPQELRRTFLKTFISLESNIDFKEKRISFIQKEKETVNIISYMLLQEGFITFIKKRKDIYQLRLKVSDFSTYLKNVGWIENKKIKEKLKKFEFKEYDNIKIPINRKAVLQICKSLGLNSFHTFKKRKNLLSRDWYIGYKALKEGKNSISSKFLRLMIKDLRQEVNFRKNLDLDTSIKTDPRHVAVLCGLLITEIRENTNLSNNTIWNLYSNGQCIHQEKICEFIKKEFHQRIATAEKLLSYLQGLLKEEIFYDKVKEIKYEYYKGKVFGLTVPDLKNYLAGFGACGINHNTYPLPEAQLDRFLFKSLVDYPNIKEEKIIMSKNISIHKFEEFEIKKACSTKDIISIQNLIKKLFLHDKIKDYITAIMDATRKPHKYGVSLGKYIEWGGSPRATINFFIAAKANAFLNGRTFVIPQDIKDIAHNILRHRILLSYDAKVMNIGSDQIVDEILSKVRVP